MTSVNGVYVIGSGGLAKMVFPILYELEGRSLAVFDDEPHVWVSLDDPTPVVGPLDSMRAYAARPTILAIGDNAGRSRLAGSHAVPWLNLLAAGPIIDRDVQFGGGTVVSAGVVLQADARIGHHVYLSPCASVSHDRFIDDYTHLAPGCRITGGVTVSEERSSEPVPQSYRERESALEQPSGPQLQWSNDLPDGVVPVGIPTRIKNQRPRALAYPDVRDRLTNDCDSAVPPL